MTTTLSWSESSPIRPFIRPCIHLFDLHPSIYQSINYRFIFSSKPASMYIHLSISPFTKPTTINLSFHISLHLCLHPSTNPSNNASTNPLSNISTNLYLPVHPPIHPSILYPSIHFSLMSTFINPSIHPFTPTRELEALSHRMVGNLVP